MAGWAEGVAFRLLGGVLPRRWAHTRGAARQARRLAVVLGDDAELLEAAAWLHDIGYSPDLVRSGFHPLDGARHLRDVEGGDESLCRLVAHHSCAVVEADERGLMDVLGREFAEPRTDLAQALIFCDMTTDPYGGTVSVGERLADIFARYDNAHVVSRAIRRSAPLLTEATEAVAQRVTRVADEPRPVRLESVEMRVR